MAVITAACDGGHNSRADLVRASRPHGNHLQVFGMHECQAVPPAVRFRPERVQLLVKALLSGGVERGEGAIDGAVVEPEEVHNVRRRERVIQRVVSSSALELTYLRTESFSHDGFIAPQQW